MEESDHKDARIQTTVMLGDLTCTENTEEELQETVHIALVRIHVERAIVRIKNFHILKGIIQLICTIGAIKYFLFVHI